MNVRHQQRTVDLAVLRKNVQLIGGSVPEGTQLLAVVKADAYGHGMVQVAREALRAGASHLAVALVEEGVALRDAGIDAPTLVLGATSYEEALLGVEHGLTLTVCDAAMVHAVEAAAVQQGKPGLVHLKIDSGMSRIGARTEADVQAVLAALAECPHVQLTGAFTHFADADGADMAFTYQQLERFKQLTALLPGDILRHCANSAAIHRVPEAAMDMVRMGISMYGYPPVETDMPLEPFMDWRTRVTYVKDIQPGDTVSYGRTFTADKPMRVATMACGYGDGYHRAASGKAEVIIRGRRAKVLGRICMDQMMADVTDIPGVVPGDVVTLMGHDGDERITAEDLAGWAGTISYEVLLAATGRVPREWIHASDE
ncbi:MAG: alanine racemase [Clostridia bacterium]|nr:alanine racemase [Clostridia bacterium]